MVAAAIVGSAVVGAAVSADASRSAANTQADAAKQAGNNQLAMYDQNRADLASYRALGTGSEPALINAMGYSPQFDSNGNLTGMTKDASSPLNQTFSFTPGDLTKYPGYQFALQQGMQGVNASAAARGLGVSGANIRGAADYATGLANQTYGNAFNQAQDTFKTNYDVAANNANRLYQLMSTGQNSATQTANMGATAAMNSGNFNTSGAAAQAAGSIGQANALTNSLNQGMNYWSYNNALNKAYPSSNGATYSGPQAANQNFSDQEAVTSNAY